MDKSSLTLQSEVGRISGLILKHARQAFISHHQIDEQWEVLNYTVPPDYALAVDEYDQFAELFHSLGAEVLFVPNNEQTTLDSIYVRDAAVVCNRGAILCNMGKKARRAEPDALRSALLEAGIPILGAIQGAGLLEGGDVIWLDQKTLLVGEGYRTNAEGIRQLRYLVGDCAQEMHVVQLPHWRGPDDVFHLMSILSPIDRKTLLVHLPLLPAAAVQLLLNKDFELIDVPESEFESMACNILALEPGKCLMLKGNPLTQYLLEKAGIDVLEYAGDEISRKCAGGPTCLTRPTYRLID